MPLAVRMRAAALALPFERPKLAVTALFDASGDFAERLDRAFERSRAVKLPAPKVIEHEPQPSAQPERAEAIIERPAQAEHPASELRPTLRRRG